METREIWGRHRGTWGHCLDKVLPFSALYLATFGINIDNLESPKGLLPSVSEALLYLPPLTIEDWGRLLVRPSKTSTRLARR